MRQLNIGVDLDGVCYPFTESLRHYVIEHEGLDPDQVKGGGHDADESCWDFYKVYWGLTTAEFLEYCDRGVDAGIVFSHGDPFPDTVQTLKSLRSKGHKIHIVTNRSFGTRSHHNTSDWLTEHDVPYDSLIFAEDKTVLRLDIMVDDYEHNFYELWKVGVPTYLFDRPWNQHVDTDYRVKTWAEFEAVVDGMAKG